MSDLSLNLRFATQAYILHVGFTRLLSWQTWMIHQYLDLSWPVVFILFVNSEGLIMLMAVSIPVASINYSGDQHTWYNYLCSMYGVVTGRPVPCQWVLEDRPKVWKPTCHGDIHPCIHDVRLILACVGMLASLHPCVSFLRCPVQFS